MSNSSVIAVLPNPDTPLAFLPPGLANQLEAFRYIAVATLGAFIWNILTHVDIHYKLLFRSRITLATVAYFVSIIFNAAYMCTCVALHIGAIKDCQDLDVILGSFYMVTFPTTSLLFLLRVRAIYTGHKWVTAFFVICWLALTGLAITLPFSISASSTHIGTTSHCIDTGGKRITPAPIIASAVFDSLVFLFISWRLLNDIMAGESLREKIKAFCGKGGLPALSRALLYSGQVYYLISICINIATVVLILTPSVPGLIHGILNIPNSALTCTMACKVYTDLKFGSYQDTEAPGCPSTFLPAPRHTTQLSSPLGSADPGARFEELTFNGVYPTPEAALQLNSHKIAPSSEAPSGHCFEA